MPNPTAEYQPNGDSIENASLQFFLDTQQDVIHMLNERNKKQSVICRIAFSPRDKYKITCITLPDNGNVTRVIMQGAAEVVVNCCQKMLDQDLNKVPIEHSKEDIVDSIIGKKIAQQGLVPVAYAFQDVNTSDLLKIINDFGQESDQFERAIINNLTYVCTFGLKNDLRENAVSSISLIRYGISKPNTTITDQVKVRMVSGDHIETCRRVALDAGIINKEEAEDP